MLLFGKKKEAAQPKVDINNVIRDLRENITLLDKREAHLQKQVVLLKAEAMKKHKAKDKRGAISCMKRMKLTEKEIENIYGKKDALWMQTTALEAASSNKATLDAMKKGTAALKATVSDSVVEEVNDVMDELNEHLNMAEEVNNAMAQPIGNQMDKDELWAELSELETLDTEAELLETPDVPVKPLNGKVRHDEVVEEEPSEENALAALQAEMGLA